MIRCWYFNTNRSNACLSPRCTRSTSCLSAPLSPTGPPPPQEYDYQRRPIRYQARQSRGNLVREAAPFFIIPIICRIHAFSLTALEVKKNPVSSLNYLVLLIRDTEWSR